MLASRPAHSAWSTSTCGEADSRRSGEPPLERPEHPDGFSGPPGVLDSGPAPGGAGTSAGGTAQDVDGGGETDHVLDDRAPYGHGRQVVGGGAKRSPWNTVKLALRPGAIAPSSTPAVCAAESVYAVRASARVSRLRRHHRAHVDRAHPPSHLSDRDDLPRVEGPDGPVGTDGHDGSGVEEIFECDSAGESNVTPAISVVSGAADDPAPR